MLAKEAKLTWLNDPEVFQVNRIKAHSDHRYYESAEEMEAGRNAASVSR